MGSILRREWNAYFSSPIGYIYLAVYYFFSGLFFFMFTLSYNTNDITSVFSNMFTIVLFLIPILTMRLFSEDKKYRTDQALLTAPVSLTGLVMGKYLAAVAVFATGLSITILFGLIVNFFVAPNWGMIWGNFIAMLLLGMAVIAIGMLISSLTESQVIAATGGFAAGMILMLVDVIAQGVQNPFLSKILQALSFSQHYYSFQDGIFRLADVLFFLGACAVFIFLTVRSLEKRRWS
ncbi:MAG: ABC transporter permease subunit [Oscillospiraceae bacterium]